jgi:hypothetical protein
MLNNKERMKLKKLLLPILALVSGSLVAQIPTGFDADALYVLIDADLEKRSYNEVMLSDNMASKDQLQILTKDSLNSMRKFEVSNSMKGFSNQSVASFDGRYVLVSSGNSSARGYASYSTQKGMIRVLDTKHGNIVEEEIDGEAGAIAINHLKGLVAVVGAKEANSISLLVWNGKSVTNTIEVSLKGLVAKDRISNLVWSSTGSYLAVTFEASNKVAFYRLTNDNEGISLELKGKPVQGGVNPALGIFSQDEQYFYVADQNVDFEKGAVSTIKLDLVSGQHEFLQSVTTNIGPEMIRMSPDGKYVMTVNRRGAHLSPSDKDKTRMTSLSVFKVSKNGKLKPVGEYPFASKYPSDLRFDKSGNMLAVVAHNSASDDEYGELMFWDFMPNKKIQLQQRDELIQLPKGAHSLIIK